MSEVAVQSLARPLRGRPRGFDRDVVLAKAAGVFARDGYEGLSVADLAAELGLNHPSLYAAFGPKAALYREALDWAETRWAKDARRVLATRGVVRAVGALLERQVEVFVEQKGCMLSDAMQTHARDHALEARHARRLRNAMISVVKERLEEAVCDGELDRSKDVRLLATYLVTQVHGLSVLARDGAELAMLKSVAGIALNGFALSAGLDVSDPKVQPLFRAGLAA